MAQPYVGQIIAVGFNFAPVGWMLCQGQTLSIADNSVLFTLIGTTYGGDGVNTFALPNLCGRVAINQGQGQGQGLSPYVIGQLAGTENVTLTTNQLGSHMHSLMASSQPGSSNTPGNTVALAQNGQTAVNMYSADAPNTTLSSGSISAVGNSNPHENRQPFLTISYIIAVEGIFPSQN